LGERELQNPERRTISVFGLGYVGCVSVACLAQAGHRVIGVDVRESKVELVMRGVATIVEPGLDELLLEGRASGTLTATLNAEDAIRSADVVLITVGTPSHNDGTLDLSHIFLVAEQIGRSLRDSAQRQVVAIRSTIKPGTCAEVTRIIERHSGKRAGEHFSVVANPEFLREGTAVRDYLNPPFVLIGASDEWAADEVADIYSNVNGEIVRVELAAAEIIKYVNNSWHALKVAFGNEIGAVCKALRIDSRAVIDVFLRDRVLNISASYLRPGFAFGGACLPKDLAALVALSKEAGVEAPLLNSVKPSNERHIDRAIALIRGTGCKRIGFLGLSFKADTDDVRNSPALRVIEALAGQPGYDIRVFDESVQFALASGRAIAAYRASLGDVAGMLVETSSELLTHAELIVVAKNDRSFAPILDAAAGKKIIDLAGLPESQRPAEGYFGLAW
jgi:GDP-mannose 6-dehydrogenase